MHVLFQRFRIIRLQLEPGASTGLLFIWRVFCELEADGASARKLKREGIQASVQAPYGQKTIRIDPGPVWLNMEMFYSERKRPDLEDYLLERARFFVENEKQNKERG